MQWRRVAPCNIIWRSSTPHPVYIFWGSIWVMCNDILAISWSTTAHSSGISAYYVLKFVSFKSWPWGWLIMKMTFVSAAESRGSYQWIPKPADKSHQHAQSALSVWSLLGRAVRLVHLFPSTQTLVIHHHILVCTSPTHKHIQFICAVHSHHH